MVELCHKEHVGKNLLGIVAFYYKITSDSYYGTLYKKGVHTDGGTSKIENKIRK